MRNGALYEAIDSTARNNIVVDTVLAGLGSIAGDDVRFENNTVINAAKTGQAVFRAAANEAQTPASQHPARRTTCSHSRHRAPGRWCT